MSVILQINVKAARFNPEIEFKSPHDLSTSLGLTRGQKIATLDRWRQSVLRRMSATNEGMSPEGTTDHDTLLLAAINACQAEMKQRPNNAT
jgi:hypothetical protein